MTQQPKRSPRPFRQTITGATYVPSSVVSGKKKLPPFVAKQLEEMEAIDEWYAQWSDPATNSALTHSVAKGQDKTQLCRCCHEPFKQNRLKYGIPANRPFDGPEFYCPECFKTLNCKGVR